MEGHVVLELLRPEAQCQIALHAYTRERHKLSTAMQPSFAEDIVAAGGVPLLIGLLERSSDPRLHAAAAAGLQSIALSVPDAPAAIAAAGGVKARCPPNHSAGKYG